MHVLAKDRQSYDRRNARAIMSTVGWFFGVEMLCASGRKVKDGLVSGLLRLYVFSCNTCVLLRERLCQ